MQFKAVLFPMLAFAAASYAQPSIANGSAAPGPGDAFTLSAAIGVGPAGSGGADQTWDFSAATFGAAIGTATFASPVGTPYADKFGSANLAMKLEASVNPNPKWDYYKLGADKWEHLGANFGGQDGDDFSQDPITELWFPVAYGDSTTDTFCKKNRTDTTHVGLSYDGYGTLKLPGTTYQVFRIRRDYGTYFKVDFYTTNPLFVIASHNSSNQLLVVFTPKAPTSLRKRDARISPKLHQGFVLLPGMSTVAQGLSLRSLDGKAAPARAASFRVLAP